MVTVRSAAKATEGSASECDSLNAILTKKQSCGDTMLPVFPVAPVTIILDLIMIVSF